MSAELTLFYKEYHSFFKLRNIYLVDPIILKKNKYVKHWDARHSIVSKIKNNAPPPEKMSKKMYNLYF